MSRELRITLIVGAGLALGLAVADVSISPEVREAVTRGRARVIVELQPSGGFKPEGELSQALVEQQRGAIADAQDAVLAALATSNARLLRKPETLPFLALEIGADDLETLGAMPALVNRIHLDGIARTQPHAQPQGDLP